MKTGWNLIRLLCFIMTGCVLIGAALKILNAPPIVSNIVQGAFGLYAGTKEEFHA